MRTHFYTLITYAWTRAFETPTRGFIYPYIKHTLHQEFFHKRSNCTRLPLPWGWRLAILFDSGIQGTHLGDLGVGAFNIVAGPVQPGVGRAGAVLVEGASALAAAPTTLKLPVGL